MKVKQHAYLSEAAMQLRRRDGTRPWGTHPSEVDSLKPVTLDDPIRRAWAEAQALRAAIEAVATTPPPTPK